MNYSQHQKGKSSLPIILVLLAVTIAFAMMSAESLNRIREGQTGFLTNLWSSQAMSEESKSLTMNPVGLAIPNHVKTIMLMGSDQTPDGSYRTDVLLLVSFNLENGKINLFSFPRDLWVEIPGVGPQRINTAHPVGGNDLLGETLFQNFSFYPDHYAMVDFKGFKQLIQLIGGVDVEVTQRMEDKCDFNDAKWCVVEPGKQHMDSNYALWYVRARLNTSDFDRTRRAQEVIQAIVQKVLSPANIMNLPKFVKTSTNVVETDMKLTDVILYAFPLSKFVQDDVVTTYTLTPNEAVGFVTDAGAMVLQPNYSAIAEILKKVFWIN